MRKKELKGDIFAIKLTADNLEIVEKACKGSIKGIKLERKLRCIDFYADDEEHRIEMGQYYVEFRNGSKVMKQVWTHDNVGAFLKDVDDVSF